MTENNKNKIINLDNLALEIYGDRNFAESYARKIEYNAHNALYERPATLSLIKNPSGKKILDAGCGPGVYSSWLSDNGACVTAIDFSEEMIRLTKEKTGDSARVIQANLNLPMDFLEDEEFDMIVSSMVIHYIKDLRKLFSEFNRVLKTGGELIFSTGHPFTDYSLHPGGNYFETEIINDDWSSYNISMPSFRRPLNELFSTIKETDFRIDELLEPQPSEECRLKFNDIYEILSRQPWFIFFKLIKEK